VVVIERFCVKIVSILVGDGGELYSPGQSLYSAIEIDIDRYLINALHLQGRKIIVLRTSLHGYCRKRHGCDD
jgi:hypothetical protein